MVLGFRKGKLHAWSEHVSAAEAAEARRALNGQYAPLQPHAPVRCVLAVEKSRHSVLQDPRARSFDRENEEIRGDRVAAAARACAALGIRVGAVWGTPLPGAAPAAGAPRAAPPAGCVLFLAGLPGWATAELLGWAAEARYGGVVVCRLRQRRQGQAFLQLSDEGAVRLALERRDMQRLLRELLSTPGVTVEKSDNEDAMSWVDTTLRTDRAHVCTGDLLRAAPVARLSVPQGAAEAFARVLRRELGSCELMVSTAALSLGMAVVLARPLGAGTAPPADPHPLLSVGAPAGAAAAAGAETGPQRAQPQQPGGPCTRPAPPQLPAPAAPGGPSSGGQPPAPVQQAAPQPPAPAD